MKKKLNCKEIPQRLYAVINSEVVEYIYEGAEQMSSNIWYSKYESSHDYDIYYLVFLENDGIYVKDKMFFDDKKECIEDYLEYLSNENKWKKEELLDIMSQMDIIKDKTDKFTKLLNSFIK